MTDKELLELAARAVDVGFVAIDGVKYVKCGTSIRQWNPLSNDDYGKADCLQMEIDLKLELSFSYDGDEWIVSGYMADSYRGELARHPDRQRASTMAVAEIGKNLSA